MVRAARETCEGLRHGDFGGRLRTVTDATSLLLPEEQCNRYVKHALLNALPRDVDALRTQARREFRRLSHRSDLLASFFAHAGLRDT